MGTSHTHPQRGDGLVGMQAGHPAEGQGHGTLRAAGIYAVATAVMGEVAATAMAAAATLTTLPPAATVDAAASLWMQWWIVSMSANL